MADIPYNKLELLIRRSASGDFRHFVFRGEDPAALPADLSALNYLTPVAIVNEVSVQNRAKLIDEVLVDDLLAADADGRRPFPLGFLPYVPSGAVFRVSISQASGTVDYEMSFGLDGVITSVSVSDGAGTVQGDPSNFLVLGQCLYVSKIILPDVYSLTAEYDSMFCVFLDDSLPMAGVSYNGPAAVGLRKPGLDVEVLFSQVSNATRLPSLRVAASGAQDGIVYYYRIVSMASDGRLAGVPSDLAVLRLDQPAENLSYGFDVLTEGGWVDGLVQWTAPTVDLLFDSADKPKLIDMAVPSPDISSVDIDKSSLVSSNRVILSFASPWALRAYARHYRTPLPLRFYVRDTFGNRSEFTDPYVGADCRIPVEKMVVLRKDVTQEAAPAAPIVYDDALVVKVWKRHGGVYHDPLSDPASVDDPDALSSVSLMSDSGVVESIRLHDVVGMMKLYNYTLYAVDAYGNRSEPAVVLVDTFV